MIYKINKNSNDNKISSNLDLIYSIFQTEAELLSATNNYEFADKDLIDYYSYHIKATKSKLDYLMKKAKNRGILIDRTKQIELRFENESQIS